MIKIIRKPKDLSPFYTFKFQGLQEMDNFFKSGFFGEYWENEIINFKFFYTHGLISVFPGFFMSGQEEEDIRTFIEGNLCISEIYSWTDAEVSLDVLKSLQEDSSELKDIYRFDTRLGYSGIPWEREKDVQEKEGIFKNYQETRLTVQGNSVVFHSLPYKWGLGIDVYTEISEISERTYYGNLLMLKIMIPYVK